MRKKKVESEVVRCLRNVNVGQMHVILNGEQREGVDCLKNVGWQVAAD